MRRIHAIVEGRVQGVGFRYWALDKAQDLGLAGWVRNLRDGRVETEAQGPEPGVAAYLEFLGAGPPAARVSRVDVSEADVHSGESNFRIR